MEPGFCFILFYFILFFLFLFSFTNGLDISGLFLSRFNSKKNIYYFFFCVNFTRNSKQIFYLRLFLHSFLLKEAERTIDHISKRM